MSSTPFLHRLRLTVGRHRLGAADNADLHDALAGLVDVVDEALERNAVGRRRRHEYGGLQRQLLGAGRRARDHQQRRTLSRRLRGNGRRSGGARRTSEISFGFGPIRRLIQCWAARIRSSSFRDGNRYLFGQHACRCVARGNAGQRTVRQTGRGTEFEARPDRYWQIFDNICDIFIVVGPRRRRLDRR